MHLSIYSMECLPIKTCEDLDAWCPDDQLDGRVCSVPIVKRKEKPKGTPKTLLCHDMCGGYLTDKSVHGYIII